MLERQGIGAHQLGVAGGGDGSQRVRGADEAPDGVHCSGSDFYLGTPQAVAQRAGHALCTRAQ